jgi:hypothetical protein
MMSSAVKFRLGIAVGVALALAIAGFSAIAIGRSKDPSRAVTYPDPIVGVCGDTPWTLTQAADSMPFAILLPDDSLANDASLAHVWRCSDIQVAFEYSSGVVVYLSTNTLKDPAAVWERMAAEYPEFSVGTVRGTMASLSDPTKGNGTAPGGVDLVEGNLRITVSGNGKIPLSDLVAVTETLRPIAVPQD